VTLGRLKEVLALAGVAAVGSNAVTALLGAAVTSASQGVPFWRTWFSWWMSNGLGMLQVAPLILSLRDSARWLKARGSAGIIELVCLFTSLFAVAWIVFSGIARSPTWIGPLPYLTFPWLMYAALQTGPFFATVASIIVSATAVWFTVHGAGPFVGTDRSLTGAVLGVQAFVSIAVLSALLPAAAVAERRHAQRQLRRLNRLYAVLSETSQAVVRAREVRPLMSELCRIAVESGGFRLAWIGMLDKDGQALEIAATGGPAMNYVETRIVPMPAAADTLGPAATALRENRLTLVNDIGAVGPAIPWRGRALMHGLRAAAAVPLCVEGTVRGVFTLYAGDAGVFDVMEARLLDQLSATVSFGLESMELAARRIAAEKASASAFQRFRAVFEHANDGILLLDDQRVVECNPRAEAILGYSRQQLLDRAPADVVSAALADEAYALLLSGGPDTPAATDLLQQATLTLKKLAEIDPTMAEAFQLAESLSVQADDLGATMRRYRESVEYSPSRLDELEERLEAIRRIKRKYGGTVQAALEYAARAAAELDTIQHSEERLAELREKEEAQLRQIGDLAARLSQTRQQAAARLAQSIERELGDLRMAGGRFVVNIEQQEDPDGAYVGERRLAFDATGVDRIEFLMSANPGEPLRPLAKVASGGEAARIMLALKGVLGRVDQTPTLIFDEIDQGIGGRIGTVVGQKLWGLTESHQVFVVTHLAQLAGFADVHFRIHKLQRGGRTITLADPLDDKGRVTELAEMLGAQTDSGHQSAHDILMLARRVKEGQGV
jgi:DNA repair protein RecN (Recombination protein N)